MDVNTQEYPLTLDQIRRRLPDVSFGATPPIDDLADLGFAEVVLVGAIPEGDVVTEGAPKLVDGVWQRTWVSRAYSDEELSARLTERKQQLSQAVMQLRDQDLQRGFEYTTEGVYPFHVQLRVEDRINLLALNLQGQQLVAAESDATIAFRGLENVTVQLTGAQMVDMTTAALHVFSSIYELSWELKDDIEQATTVADLPELPDTLIS
jgi:hypothetical protein